MQSNSASVAFAAFLLRVSLGLMFLSHSLILKLMVLTISGTVQCFVSIGLPGPLAYLVFTMEAVGGVLLILGIQVRIVSLVLLPVLLGATWAHAGNGWMFGYTNGGCGVPPISPDRSASLI